MINLIHDQPRCIISYEDKQWKYQVEMIPEDEGGGFDAHLIGPNKPSHRATGETTEEAAQNLFALMKHAGDGFISVPESNVDERGHLLFNAQAHYGTASMRASFDVALRLVQSIEEVLEAGVDENVNDLEVKILLKLIKEVLS